MANHNEDHCIILNINTYKIFCYQCEIEILDNYCFKKKNKEMNFLNLRKIFFSKNCYENKIEKKYYLNFQIFNDFQPSLNSLQSVIFLLYSVDFLRKTFKKLYLSNNFVNTQYKKKLNSKIISSFSEIIYYINKKEKNEKAIINFYLNIIKKDKSLGSYQNNTDLTTYFLKVVKILHEKIKIVDYKEKNLENFNNKNSDIFGSYYSLL